MTYQDLFFALLLASPIGCTPSIGDKCVLSTDCSVQGTRICDTSQPNGYCTQFNCLGDDCPDQATCVQFNPGIPGCLYNDRTTPGRSARTLCLKLCSSNSDCRTEDGFVCADPRQAPWNALILDDDQTQHVCIIPPDNGATGGDASRIEPDAAVCQAQGPLVSPVDAQATWPPPDAGAGPTDANEGGGVGEGGADAPPGDAGDAG